MLMDTRRKPGRPPKPAGTALHEIIHIRISTPTYDALCKGALRHRVGFNEYLRKVLDLVVRAGYSPEPE